MMATFKDSLQQWAEGSPPISDKVYHYIYKEFSLLFFSSCWFLDMRPKYVAASITFFTMFMMNVSFHLCCGLVTIYKQRSDMAAAATSAVVAIIHILTFSMTILINFKRNNFIKLFRALSEDFYNYGDSEDIPEMLEEIRSSQKQKVFVFILNPAYMALTFAIGMAGRSIDPYFGFEETAPYVNDVYMLVPVPLWYPFKVSSYFLRLVLVLAQAVEGGMNAAVITTLAALQVVFMQGLGLQIKILKYRLRKLRGLAYRHNRKQGGDSIKPTDVHSNQDFLKSYNLQLNLCAAHHINIITNFNHLHELLRWPIFVGVLTISVMIALTLTLMVVGIKPSTLSLAGILFFDELVNAGMMCWQTEQVMELAASLHEELYGIDWMDLDLQAKRTLMIMTERTKKPLVLKAAVTNTPLNWEIFSKILNTAYSYVNLLSAATPTG